MTEMLSVTKFVEQDFFCFKRKKDTLEDNLFFYDL